MTAPRDPDRLIDLFLAEGLDELPVRSYDAVRSDIDRIRQRVVFIDPWRHIRMSSNAKLALAAAAVVVLAIAGLRFLPGGSGPGGPPTPAPSPTAAPPAFPSAGPLSIGRHDVTLEGVRFSFELTTPGWEADNFYGLGKGVYGEPGNSAIVFWESAPDNVYADPCRHTHLDPKPAHTPEALAEAVSTLPGTDLVDGPSSVTVGGQPAQTVAVRIRDDIACGPNDFWRWYDDSSPGSDNWRNGADRGATIRAWIIDVDGAILWIDGETFAGADETPGLAIQAVIDSIQFE